MKDIDIIKVPEFLNEHFKFKVNKLSCKPQFSDF